MNKLKTFAIATLAAAASFLGYRSSQGASVPPQITTALMVLGITGQPYAMPLTATGGKMPYRWTAEGLPFGLSVSGSNLTGTISKPFEGTITLTVTDRANKKATVTLPLAVCNPVVILNPPTHPIEAGKSYQFYADGGAESANPPKCNPPTQLPL